MMKFTCPIGILGRINLPSLLKIMISITNIFYHVFMNNVYMKFISLSFIEISVFESP